MDRVEASSRLWVALMSVDQYLARGLQQQVSSSRSFGGDDMKPILSAYQVFKETEPFLPPELIRATDALFQITQNEMNGYLDALRKAIEMPKDRHEAATKMVHGKNEQALNTYRKALNVVKEKIPPATMREADRVINNYGQIGAVGSNANFAGTSFKQSPQSMPVDTDLAKLSSELKTLRSELRKVAVDVEHDQAVASVGAAEMAAQNGDAQSTMSHLRSAGKWALDAATKIGVEVAVKAIEASMKS